MRRAAACIFTSLLCLLGAVGEAGAARQHALNDHALSATPAGLTLVETSLGSVLANADGRLLYTYDKDGEGKKPRCEGECAMAWTAAAAPANAKPTRDWSIAIRKDRARQWAYKGKPVYTRNAPTNTDIDEIETHNAGGVLTFTLKAAPQDWQYAVFTPSAGVALPDGIEIEEIPDAIGQGFVDSRGMTLYVADEKFDRACAKKACDEGWAPLLAPEMAGPVGTFSIVTRQDGSRQWARGGERLYTFTGDSVRGDANGVGVDAHIDVAMLQRYYMPAEVKLQKGRGMGAIMATADGKTIYYRDRFRLQYGGRFLYNENHMRRVEHIGREIGTTACDAACLKMWHPVVAPADAQPMDYWHIDTRPDGVRQWAYRGYALYTYAGDKPGEANGNESFDIIVGDNGPYKVAEGGATPGNALFWRVSVP
jgi:predicted lipoprotein with Yx(FWY)xxD motif